MAAGGPTRPLLQKIRVIDIPNENVPGYFLLLEMALQTQRRITFVQQSLVDRAMGRMADHATLTHRLVFIHEWAALLRMTLEADLVSAHKSKAARFERLLNICRGALGRDPLVRLMAIAAAHLAFKHRMMMRQLKCCANLKVTLETSVRRFLRINDRASAAPGLNVQTPGAVARLAADVLCVFPSRLEASVSSCPKVAHDLFVACRAFLRPHELRARDAGRGNNCSARSAAGKQNNGQRNSSANTPQQAFAPTMNPSNYPRRPHGWRVCPETEKIYQAIFSAFSYTSVTILPVLPALTAARPNHLCYICYALIAPIAGSLVRFVSAT
jgi:hypothetical protein